MYFLKLVNEEVNPEQGILPNGTSIKHFISHSNFSISVYKNDQFYRNKIPALYSCEKLTSFSLDIRLSSLGLELSLTCFFFSPSISGHVVGIHEA